MTKTKEALIWITNILKKHHIPFQISGGLAAKVYGSKRQLADIDIDIPEDKFDLVTQDVGHYITYGPKNFKSEKWDLLLMTLNYQNQEIDLSGADNTKIFNEKTGAWEKLCGDLSQAVIKNVMEIKLPVIPRGALISYKKVLARPEDLIDVNEIEKNLTPND